MSEMPKTVRIEKPISLMLMRVRVMSGSRMAVKNPMEENVTIVMETFEALIAA
jgi:hypothetical protein